MTPTGGTYALSYDASGNLTSYTDPDGGAVSATYAPGTDLLTSFTNQTGDTTNYSYNSAGDLTGITYEDGTNTSYQYSSNGLLISSTDASGQTTTYSYNTQGLLTRETFSDGTFQAYVYNSQGELISAQATNGGVTAYTYNVGGELTSVTNPSGQVESYTYNSGGQELTRTEPDGSVTQYSYNAAGELDEIENGSGNLITQYSYNAVGQRVGSLDGNGQTTSFSYDADGNVTQILTKAADGAITSQLDYTYDADGRPVTATSLDGTWTYTYDAMGQLTNAVFASSNSSIPNQNLTYEYDAAGNRTEIIFNGAVNDYTTNGLNQYTASDGTTYDYDADGNLVSMTQNGVTTTYTYNSQNQLIAESGPNGDCTYQYDALGNLVSSSDDGVVSNYIIDPLAISTSATGPLSAIAQVYNAAGDVTATYDYGDGLAAMIDSGGIYYYNMDAAGDITSLSGASGSLADTYDYAPFGTLLASSGSVINPFQYSGGLGVATGADGLVDMRARYYDPITGRFISRDPINIASGANLYDFADNSPIGYLDPTGEFGFNVGKILSGLTGTIEGGFAIVGAPVAALGTTISVGSVGIAVGLGEATLAGLALPEVAAAAGIAVAVASIGLGGWAVLKGEYDIINGGIVEPNGFEWGQTQEYVATVNNLINYDQYVGPAGGVVLSIPTVSDKIVEDAASIVNYISSIVRSIPSTLSNIGSSILGWMFPDPHLITFDGLRYNFQTVGDFVLVKDTNGSPFQVQAQLTAPAGVSTYTIITEIGIQVGADVVTIDPTRSAPVWVDGEPVTFTGGTFALALGQITKNGNTYVVTLGTGESVTANVGIQDLSVSVSLGPFAQHNSVEGLLGNYNGDPLFDLTLPDGTIINPNAATEVYGVFANAWQVTPATSLLADDPGQTTATSTDPADPSQLISVSSFPAQAIASATQVVEQAGITDPGLQQAAIYDYLVTGDPSLVSVEANLQQQGVTTVAQADVALPPPPPEVGIFASTTSVVENIPGPTTATFQVYLTGDTSQTVTVDWTVVASDATFLGPSDFGGTLPSGTVTLGPSQTSADLSISLPGTIGTAVSKTLEVQVSAASPAFVIGAAAQEAIVNAAPVAGAAPDFGVEFANDPGLLPTQSGTSSTFDLGAVEEGAVFYPGTLSLAVLNLAGAGADDLAATVVASGDGGLTTNVSPMVANLAPGGMFDIGTLAVATTSLGPHSETFTITPYDTNATGYSAILATETVTVTDTVVVPTAPVITVPTTATVGVGQAGGISGISLAETGATSGESFTVSLSDSTGDLAATGSGVSGSDTTSLTVTGSLGQVNTYLATLTDTDVTAGSDTITVSASDSIGGAATPATIAVTVNGLPVVAAPATTMAQQDAATAINGLSLSETGNTSGETFTVTLSDANGDLAATGTGVSGSGTTSLSINGPLAQVTSDLATLTDAEAGTAVDMITVNASDGFGNSAAQQTISVSVTSTTAPVLGSGGNTVFWTEGNSPTVIDSGLTVSDAGSNTLTGATATISIGFLTGDVLSSLLRPRAASPAITTR